MHATLLSFLRTALFALALVCCSWNINAAPIPTSENAVTVECTRSSSLVVINITNHRKIGNVTIEIRDAKGRSVYFEEGKAMSDELVRRLDKGLFPLGEATLTVTARDIEVTQPFVVK